MLPQTKLINISTDTSLLQSIFLMLFKKMIILIIYLFNLLMVINCHPSQSYHPPRLVVFSFDAFRYDYLHPKLTPNLYRLSRQGVFSESMQNVYVTKTFPNHHSISTGLYEENHGIVSNYMFDNKTNSTFEQSTTDSKWWDNGHIKPIWNVNELFDLNQRASALMMWPGTGALINGRLPHYSHAYERNLDWKKRINIIMNWLLNDKLPANLVMAYFNEPDSTSHHYGPFSPEVHKKITEVDDIVQFFIDQLTQHQILHSTNIIILSDHGMAEINPKNLVDLSKFVDPSLYVPYGTTPVLNLWIKDKNNINQIYDKLKQHETNNHFKVYLPTTVPEEYHYGNNERVLDIIVEADEGWEVVDKIDTSNKYYDSLDLVKRNIMDDNDSNILDKFERRANSSIKFRGNHGYTYKYDSMKPMFVAFGPAFKKHYQHPRLFKNIDLYPLMCEVLHIRSTDPYTDAKLCRSNGSLSRINSILRPIVVSGDLQNENATFFRLFIVLLTGFMALLFCASLFTCLANSANRSRKRRQLANIDLSNDVIDINIEGYQPTRSKKVSNKYSNQNENVSLLKAKQEALLDSDHLTD